ncbi:metallophosphoesterase [Variovorax sp. dw_308]|uniref:metallophosphoesterase n=1 Tax=Variovorax sp. dw_308 TaxID=2721546 RepID=UPI003529C9F3
MEYDLAILAGDIVAPGRVVAPWLRRPARFGNKPVVHVAGNHEYYDSVMDQEEARMRRNAEENGVQFLDCNELVVSGVRFLGCTLWTDFRLRIDNAGDAGQPVRLLSDQNRSMAESAVCLADYRAIWVDDPDTSNSLGTRRLVPMDTVQLHLRHRAWLRQKLAEPFDGPTVVVTHHAPHRNSLALRYADDWVSGAFVNKLTPEYFKVPGLWMVATRMTVSTVRWTDAV